MVKTIYLDQNKWIDVARAYWGKSNDKELKDVCALMKQKVENNEWVFPLSIIHHMETMTRLDERTRLELAEVMGEISRNYAILPYIYVDNMEFQNSLRKVHRLDLIEFSKEVITQDFVRAAGLDGKNPVIKGINDEEVLEKVQARLKEEMLSRNLFLDIMKRPIAKDEITEQEQNNEFYKKSLEDLRKSIYEKPKQFRYDVYLVHSYIDHFKKNLTQYLEDCRKKGIAKEDAIPEDTFKDKPSTLAFLEASPSFCVRTRLIYDICNDRNRDIDKNDFKDIAFLSSAVPYCDVVITEKLWAHLLRKNRLDEKYDTMVTNSLADLKYL